MNCRCKKDKSGEMQCHLKTQPRLKLKSLIRKECDGRKVISLEYFLYLTLSNPPITMTGQRLEASLNCILR